MTETTIVVCRDCGKNYRVRQETAHKRRRCKECGGVVGSADEYAESDFGQFDQPSDGGYGYEDDYEYQSSAEDGYAYEDEYDYQPRPRKRRKRSARGKKRGGSKKSTKRQSSQGYQLVARGLRCILIAIFMHVAAFLIAFIPGTAYVVRGMGLAASVLALVGQAMCISVPTASGTRSLFIGVVGLQTLSLILSFAAFSVPALYLFATLASVGSFFLFVYGLRQLAGYIESAKAEADAEWILYWGAGLYVLREVPSRVAEHLGAAVGGAMVYVVLIATLVIGILILLRYIDLLGNLKDDLESA